MRPGPRTYAMALLAGCFAVSAAARLTDPRFAAAIAEEAASFESEKSGKSGASDKEMSRLLDAIGDRQEDLESRENRIAERERELDEAAAALREELARLREAEARLAKAVEVASTAAEEDVARLVSTYETMDQKRAAAIFGKMDVGFAAGLLGAMKNQAAAGILEALPPEKAYAITAYIAGRNAGRPGQ